MNNIGNRGGIVYTIATQIDGGSSTTNAVYTLPDHIFRYLGPVGIMIVTFPVGSTSTIQGISVQVNNYTLSLTNAQGVALTSPPDAGDYILSFNKVANTLKLLD